MIHEDDVARMPGWAQEQIRRKLGQPGGGKRGGGTKYHNTPTTRTAADGTTIRFPSIKEAEHYDKLMLLLNAGAITDLKLQPQFTLQEAYTTPQGKRVQAIRYVADFSYTHPETGQRVVVDVKGGRATQTRVYALKRKLLLERLGVEITEV